jgi:dipeptidyl aminopeptidase/acylaminoacyl peptidase
MPHSLIWAEALDEGDPKKKVPHRDALFTASAGGEIKGTELLKVEHRFVSLDFFPTGNRMLVRDYDRDRKWGRTFLAPVTPILAAEPKLLWDRSVQDRYGDPGSPFMRTLPSGHTVIRTAGDPAGDTFFLRGDGATAKGDRPFLDKYDLKTGKSERLYHCPEGVYEEVVRVLNVSGTKVIVRRESQTEPPNYYYRDGTHEKQLTKNTDPAPELRKAKKQLVTTKRADGTTISFTLHLPPGQKEGEKVPAVFYAYPIEFASADTAGQVVGSPHRFTTVTGYSHLFFLTQGYAVMEVSMPIVGPPETANNSFVEQLNSNAAAAIEKATEFGIDRDRVGVMGHSYGAFMTANLLAHSNLFKAGIARSGAYNRTLTPFGFQNERRTFWEAPEIYGKMSPFYHADKIKEPLLLIHGAADSNPGTFPVQSERMYQAVRGTGGTVRLVLLPHEDHGYSARESIGHVLYEQIAWFDKYVKNAKK